MSENDTALSNEIRRTLSELEKTPVTSDEYRVIAGNLRALTDIEVLNTKTATETAKVVLENKRCSSVSPDTILLVAANLLGILAVLQHERVNVVTSKALGFIVKPR